MELNLVRKQLEQELDLLQTRLAQVQHDIPRQHSSDSEEQAQERENDEVLEEIAQETLHSIRQVQSALARLDAGTYGECECCGELIASERLRILPETTRCIKCAE